MRILSDSPIRDLWNRISLLSSEENARNFLKARISDETLIIEKARGISFCIVTAREYFQAAPEHNLTTSSLLYYYGAFSLLSALLLADISNSITLAELEEFSKAGHGLGTVDTPGCTSLHTAHLFLLDKGFLTNFLQLSKIDTSNLLIKSGQRPRNWEDVSDDDEKKLISFSDLAKRIPELLPFYDEIFTEWPLYLSYSLISYGNEAGDYEGRLKASFTNNSKHLCREMIVDILPPLDKVEFTTESDNVSKYLVSDPLETIQLREIENMPVYKSVLSQDMRIKPLKESIDDPLVYHFMLLYFLSILVRYRPNVWRNLVSGITDEYRPLIAQYLRVVERIVPNLFLDRLYGERFLFAPHSYLS